MLSHLSRVQLFAMLWTVAHQASVSMGFSRQENWNGLPCPTPRDLSDPGIEPVSLMSPALEGGFLTTIAICRKVVRMNKIIYMRIICALWRTATGHYYYWQQ